jgi:hypothetical protein
MRLAALLLACSPTDPRRRWLEELLAAALVKT